MGIKTEMGNSMIKILTGEKFKKNENIIKKKITFFLIVNLYCASHSANLKIRTPF